MTTAPHEIEQVWGNYFLIGLGNGAAMFDPVRLETVYLTEDETTAVRESGDSIVADLARFGFAPPNSAAPPANFSESVTNRLQDMGIRSAPSHIAGYRIVVTDRCNMKCSYCFVDTNTGNPDMTEEQLRQGLDLLFEVNQGRAEVTYQWFGGEPTIRHDLMRAGDAYARELAAEKGVARIQPTVVTNGAQIRPELIDHFLEYGYGVGVSIDGPPATNSLERVLLSGKPADERIHRNIKRMIDSGVHVGANVTPTDWNVGNLTEIVDYVMSLGIRFIYVNTPIPSHGAWIAHGPDLARNLFEARMRAISQGGMLFSHLDRIYQSLDSRRPRVYEHIQEDGGVNVALLPGGRISVLDLNWRDPRFIFTLDEIRADNAKLGRAAKTLYPFQDCERCPAVAICGGPSQNEHRSCVSTRGYVSPRGMLRLCPYDRRHEVSVLRPRDSIRDSLAAMRRSPAPVGPTCALVCGEDGQCHT
ncbi:radical SAM protein [Streptantibioticus ferralitis]|uniref:Radical SAM protein n=1 Tax=Streptantibioticus ferralitis TaxID=236510 RepID=A0ABT5ZD87_9ACTN|nr:radical SAM protein [Streptantibioticus ferralitis]MDF2261015.1 radical SAM protein [Streptantibioticus ferralitis]